MTTLAGSYAVLHDINVVSIVFRILLASCLGGILGMELAKSNQAACIGLAIGIGFYVGGIIAAIAFDLYIEVTSVESLPAVYKLIKKADGYIRDKEITAPRQDGSCSTIVSVKLAREKNPDDIIGLLHLEEYVKEVKFINYSIRAHGVCMLW
nr:hypothetical protein [uncultured Agathobaculum sp.]